MSSTNSRLLVAAALLVAAVPAMAAFTGGYADANWTSGTQTFGCGSSVVDRSGMPNTVVLRTATGCASIANSFRLTNPIPVSGTLAFDWSYAGTVGHHEAVYWLDGVRTVLASGSVTRSGRVTLAVTAGQTFYWNLLGGTNASLTVGNFTGPQSVTPTVAIPTLDFWAKLGLAGLVAAAALRGLRRRPVRTPH